MAMPYTEVNAVLRELRADYYAALKRQDLEGFLLGIAVKLVAVKPRETEVNES